MRPGFIVRCTPYTICMSEPAFDTVIVPDFRDATRVGRFEPQTLFFLASWIEHAGDARDWPVHIACIGEPPTSVRRLAEQCGGRVSIHKSKEDQLGRFGNKLCAWDIDAQTSQLLYLDADMLCLSSPGALAQFIGRGGGCPAGLPRVPESYWVKIDQALGLPEPNSKMPSTFAAAGIPLGGKRYGSENAFAANMWPLYNGGLFFVPFDAPLPQLWIEHWNRISELFNRDDPLWVDVVLSDMTALATSLRQLQHDGNLDVITLPESFNGRWMQIVGGQVTLEIVSLFHAVNLFRNPIKDAASLYDGLDQYTHQLRQKSRLWARRVALRRGKLKTALSMLRRSRAAQATLSSTLRKLADKHVLPAMQG